MILGLFGLFMFILINMFGQEIKVMIPLFRVQQYLYINLSVCFYSKERKREEKEKMAKRGKEDG